MEGRMKKKYLIVTYGCQMNVHESEKIAGILRSRGYEECKDEKEADIIVFNTCCIRENAENHAYGNIGALKKLKRGNPGLLIAVGGCMTQQEGAAERLRKKFPFVDIVFGTHNLDSLGELLDRKAGSKKAVVDIWGKEGEIREDDYSFRTSYPNAWVNIMYGCNNFCSYCIVPYVRGRERSRAPEKISEEVDRLIDSGYKEITLLGQNVNSYGNDREGECSFPQLLRRLCRREDKFRLRFMTSNPKDFGEELVRAIAECPQICHLVHLPVQAGSDRILKLMNRKYTAAEYLRKVELLRKYVPDCQLTTDIMVGFPTETEEDFRATLSLAAELPPRKWRGKSLNLFRKSALCAWWSLSMSRRARSRLVIGAGRSKFCARTMMKKKVCISGATNTGAWGIFEAKRTGFADG